MPLFDLPKRTDKTQDKKAIKNSQKARVAVPTIKAGDSLLSRINQIKAKVEQHLGKYREGYICIQDEQTLINYIDKCIENKIVALDTETTGLNIILDDIVGICIYTPGEKSAYIPINHISYITQIKSDNQLPIEFIREQFTRLYSHDNLESEMFNADFDLRIMWNKVGVRNAYCTWESYLAMRILNENEPHNTLKKLHQKYVLNDAEDEFTFDELFKGIPFSYIPINIAYLYAAHDPIITHELCEYERKYLRPDNERKDMQDLYWVFKNIEMPCVSAVASMEDNGVLFDFDYNNKIKEKYHTLLDERIANFQKECKVYEDELNTLRLKGVKLDNPLNIASTQQLAVLLYDVMKLPLFYDKKKRKETRSTSEEALLPHKDNTIVQAILAYRELATIVGTFIDKLPECVSPTDGRIHCIFNQYGADTGRFSSKDPNLQNIPSHMSDIRPMFKATNNEYTLTIDNNILELKQFTEIETPDGWKYSDKLQVGDKILVADDNGEIVCSIKSVDILSDKVVIELYD